MRVAHQIALAAFVVASPVTAKPGDMTLAEFLPKAEKLKAQGMMAMMSSDMSVVRGEVEGAGKDYRARLKADKKAGRAPHSCPPKKGSMNSKELMQHFGTYSAAQRKSVTVRAAVFELMKTKYPC